MHITILFAAAAAVAAPQSARNQDLGRSQFISAIQNCQAVKPDTARLACYDRAASALTAATSRGDIAVIDRNQAREVRRSLFGFSLPRLPFFSGPKDREEEPKELQSTLASYRPIGNGFFRFGLTEPQSTWESTEASSVTDPKVGSKVMIKRGLFGSYFAEIGNQGAVRVRRIR